MRVCEVMTQGAECTQPDTTLADAAQRMKSLNVGALPVCEADRLVGLITDRDITVRATAQGCDPRATTVREAMTPDIVYCFDDQLVGDAARIMEDHQIRRLPVLGGDERLVGILSLGDIAVKSGDDRLSGEALEQVSEPAVPNR